MPLNRASITATTNHTTAAAAAVLFNDPLNTFFFN